jgi:dTDP-4-dehydrorhamnose reductase
VVINCAASTDPRLAEVAPEESMASNRDAVSNLARACREMRCRLIHLSTVDVYDGQMTRPYVESDPSDTRSPYGRIRCLGELAAGEMSQDFLILRLSLVCGDGSPGDPLSAIGEALEQRTTLRWDERRVSPVFDEDLGAAFATILRSDWRGVLHLANSGSCLLSELAEETTRLLGGFSSPELVGGPGPASFQEGRGANAALDVRRFVSWSGRRPRDWREALSANLRRGEGP